ncbi:MAG: DegV family protein [Actinomycetota bacterium]
MRVAVVTDSAANLPAELVARHDISVVPMVLKFGDRVLRDGVDIPEGSFYQALVEEQVPVSTSAPSIGDFGEHFERALSSADAVVCVVVASFLSATFDAATTAARAFGDRVRVVDSRSASLGEGMPALEAARAAGDGADMEAVAARAREVASRSSLIATINTFEFLRKSGRVNVVLAYAGTALNIKPVFAFRHGKLEQLGRPRTRGSAIGKLVDETRAAAARGPLHLGVVHADCEDEARALLERLAAEVETVETMVSEFTPLMGSHTGPGLLGCAFWA